MDVLIFEKYYCQSGQDKFISLQVKSLVVNGKALENQHHIYMQWLSKYYDMVMEWLFNAVAVVSCAVLWLSSSYVNSYASLVVVMTKVHRKKDTVDMVDMLLVEVMVVIIEVHMVEVLVMKTHMVVDIVIMVDTVDMIYMKKHIRNVVEGYIMNVVKEHIKSVI